MWGPYTTDDQGRLTDGLRDRARGCATAFRSATVDEVIDYLREHADAKRASRLGTMGDDGEKFGAWPGTYEHCWGKGSWVDRFFEALDENADWLTTVRPSDWLATNAPLGPRLRPDGVVRRDGRVGAAGRRGASRSRRRSSERGTQARARRQRWSARRLLAELPGPVPRGQRPAQADAPRLGQGRGDGDGPDREVALDHLHRGQSNDCYWHGLFGGIYIVHMRAATLGHLIAAEDLADAARIGDGPRDRRLRPRRARRGPARERRRRAWSSTSTRARASARGTCARRGTRSPGVLRRRPEAYHETLRRHDRRAAAAVDGAGDAAAASIHDMVQVKEAGLAGRLVYDDYERRSGLVRFLADRCDARWLECRRPRRARRPRRGPVLASTASRPDDVRLSRDGTWPVGGRVPLRSGGDGGPHRWWAARSRRSSSASPSRTAALAPLDVRVGSEWAITMLGGGGNPEAWWELDGERTQPRRAPVRRRASGDSAQGNDWLGVALEHPGRCRRRTPGCARSRRSRTRRPASSASTRAARCSSRGRFGSSRAARWAATLTARRPRSWRIEPRRGSASETQRAGQESAVPAVGIRQPVACAPRADEWRRRGRGLEGQALRRARGSSKSGRESTPCVCARRSRMRNAASARG